MSNSDILQRGRFPDDANDLSYREVFAMFHIWIGHILGCLGLVLRLSWIFALNVALNEMNNAQSYDFG